MFYASFASPLGSVVVPAALLPLLGEGALFAKHSLHIGEINVAMWKTKWFLI